MDIDKEAILEAGKMIEKGFDDDLAIARAMSNMAVDVAKGDKLAAKNYIDMVCGREPAVHRLFARVGLIAMQAALSTKQ